MKGAQYWLFLSCKNLKYTKLRIFFNKFYCSYLADEIFKKPVFIYNYPKALKPFYVRVNDDGKTVAAFDVIVPKVTP